MRADDFQVYEMNQKAAVSKKITSPFNFHSKICRTDLDVKRLGPTFNMPVMFTV